MKKRVLALLLAVTTVFCGCSQNKEEENQETIETVEKEQSIFIYNDENTGLICTGENGTVYTTNQERDTFYEYDAKGNCVKSSPLGQSDCVFSICYQDGTLYYINQDKLCALDWAEGKAKEVYTFAGEEFSFGRMVALENSIFILRKEQYKEEQAEVRYDEDDEYVYEGEELICVRTETGEAESVDVTNLKLFNQKSDKELILYAYDEEEGFYFTTYHVDKGIGEKQYTGMQLGWVGDIAYDAELDIIACTDDKGIYAVSAEKFGSKTYLYESIPAGYNTLQQAGDYLYDLFVVDGVQRMVRLYSSALMAKSAVLKGYTINESYNPPWCGYRIDMEQVLESEMALMLQAGDADWDFLLVDTGHQIMRDIQRTGAYYPMNASEGAVTLLDRTHAYVKKAATAENGDIWMLPYELSCPILIYNENLQKEYNIDFAKLDSYETLITLLESLPTKGTPQYSFYFTLLKLDIINKYIRNHAIADNKADFHKEFYRPYLEFIGKYDARLAQGEPVFQTDIARGIEPQTKEEFENILVKMESSEAAIEYSEDYAKHNYFRAAAMPDLIAGEALKNEVMAWAIVVNPNSKNLKWVLQYVDELSMEVCMDNTSFMLTDNDFSDTPLWQDIHEIVADGVIYFQYPYEIVSHELRKYILEGQSYEDTVSEMERKMNMYLNE